MQIETHFNTGGVKRVTWPPEQEYQARTSQTRQSPAFMSTQQPRASPSVNYSHQQQEQYHQNGSFHPKNQYQHVSYQNPVTNDNYYAANQFYNQSPSHTNYQRQISDRSQYPTNQTFNEPESTYLRQEPPNYLQSKPNPKPPSCTAAFAGGVSVVNKKPSDRWSHVKPSIPVHSGYVQQNIEKPLSQAQYHQNTYINNDPYAYHYQPQIQQSHFQEPQQPPVQQHYQSTHPQQNPQNSFYRQPEPGFITLRKELPITQQRPLVYASEPAAYSFGGGGNMRGDNKWPPEEYKKQSEIENEQRQQVALGPACRPRRVQKDYSGFFQRHAINSNYPGYRAPPGTQHYGQYHQ